MNFKSDFSASIVVFLVAIPLCLGIAVASGVDPLSGLISGIIGGIVVGALSGSPLSVSGPAAGLTAVILSSLQELTHFEAVLLAIVIAGIIQIILSIVKAGIIGYFFPLSVIKGMLAGIGLILIITQIPNMMGYISANEMNTLIFANDDTNMFSKMLHGIVNPHWGACSISLFSLMMYWLLDTKRLRLPKSLKFIPTALIIVLIGVFFNVIFQAWVPSFSLNSDQLVNIPLFANKMELFSGLKSPDWSLWSQPAVYKVGFTIALIASIESLLSVEAADQLDKKNRITPPE